MVSETSETLNFGHDHSTLETEGMSQETRNELDDVGISLSNVDNRISIVEES